MPQNNIAENVTPRMDTEYTGQEAQQAASEFQQEVQGEPIKGRKNSPILIAGGAVVIVTLALVALITEYL